MIAFLGIRGLGSFYYLAYALGHAEFEQPEILWVTVCNVVLVSIVLHGVIVTPVTRRLDQGRSTRPGAKELPLCDCSDFCLANTIIFAPSRFEGRQSLKLGGRIGGSPHKGKPAAMVSGSGLTLSRLRSPGVQRDRRSQWKPQR